MTHSSCKTHGIWAQKQLTDDIGEPLILDMVISRLFVSNVAALATKEY